MKFVPSVSSFVRVKVVFELFKFLETSVLWGAVQMFRWSRMGVRRKITNLVTPLFMLDIFCNPHNILSIRM
jgi:hypothetical protein